MDFHTHLRCANLSDRTVVIYDQWVRRLERWCWDRRILADEVTQEQIVEWAQTIPSSWSSRKAARQALRHWCEWLGRDDQPYDAIYVPRSPRYTCRALTVEDARRLRDMAVMHGGRQGLAVLCGMYLAARRAEIAALTWSGYGDGRMRFDRVKDGGTADLKVHPVLTEALDESRPQAVSLYLFPGDRGRPHVSPTTVWEWVRHIGRLADVVLSTHALRHTALATMNDATGDLRATQEVAGHRNPQTTAIYTRATRARMDDAMGALDY